MIRRGIKSKWISVICGKKILVFICILGVSSSFLYGEEPTKSENAIYAQLSSISVTLVTYGTKIDRGRIRKITEKSLASFGTVSPDSPKNFGNGNSVLTIMIGPIGEDSLQPGAPAKYLPVLSVSMQLLTGAELLSDKQVKIFGLAWQKESFIDANQVGLDNILDKTIQNLLSDLQEKFKGTKTRPNFFVEQP